MVESIKLLIAVIVGLMESLPQIDARGKISDDDYNVLITNTITGVINGVGFQVVGFTNTQLQGATSALITSVREWQTIQRIV
jgi:hypothetical protein